LHTPWQWFFKKMKYRANFMPNPSPDSRWPRPCCDNVSSFLDLRRSPAVSSWSKPPQANQKWTSCARAKTVCSDSGFYQRRPSSLCHWGWPPKKTWFPRWRSGISSLWWPRQGPDQGEEDSQWLQTRCSPHPYDWRWKPKKLLKGILFSGQSKVLAKIITRQNPFLC